jgi:hypothetical protein
MSSEFKRSLKSSPANILALVLRNGQIMEWMCDHCLALFAGVPYRVKSEESGVVLLDMIVCHYCYLEARKLGLRTEGPGDLSNKRSRRPDTNSSIG